MTLRILRGISWLAVMWFPLSLAAADAGGMLYAKGSVTVDGNPVTDSTAVLTGNVIETKPGAVANINIAGTTVIIQPETLVKFAANDLYIEHGSVTVASSSQMRVHAKCSTARPVTSAWTQFSAADVNGTIQVAALKGSVGISYGSEFILAKAETMGAAPSSDAKPIIVSEGQQYNQYERQGCPFQGKKGAPSAASGSVLSSPVAQIGIPAAAVAVVVTLWPRGGNSISPTEP